MKKLHKNKKIRDKVYGVGTRLVQALKLERVVDLIMVKIGRREGDRNTGELHSETEYQTEYSRLDVTPAAPRSSLALQNMIAAPEHSQPVEEPSSPQPELREPVLGFPYKRTE